MPPRQAGAAFEILFCNGPAFAVEEDRGVEALKPRVLNRFEAQKLHPLLCVIAVLRRFLRTSLSCGDSADACDCASAVGRDVRAGVVAADTQKDAAVYQIHRVDVFHRHIGDDYLRCGTSRFPAAAGRSRQANRSSPVSGAVVSSSCSTAETASSASSR